MGLGWISPVYLFGSLLLALPVLIHLVQQQRASGARFPSLMFLQRIPLKERRRLEIRHWLLLLLRCLMLLLIVLAFARPFVDSGAASVAGGSQQRDSVILLDRSYSMQLGQRWQQAQAAALQRVARASAQRRYALVLFDEETEIISDLSADTAALGARLRQAEAGLRSTRLRPALEQAARLLAPSRAAERRIVLISDFHAAIRQVPRLDDDIVIETLAVEDAADNAAITALRIGPPAAAGLGEFSLQAELANYSAQAQQRQLELVVNGRVQERRRVSLGAGAEIRESFDQVIFSGDLARGLLRLDGDALALDDRRYFVYSKNQQVPVLLIEGDEARPRQSLFVENALRLSRKPHFRLRRAGWSELDAAELEQQAVVIVNDALLPGGELAAALRTFVDGGGGLLIATGEALPGEWRSDANGFLPGRLGRRVDAAPGRARHIGKLGAGPPLGGIDLGRASIFSYREIEPLADDRVLAVYDDGAAALLERRFGAGRTLLLGTTLDTLWNDLALQPEFLPLLHRLLNYLAVFESYPHSRQIGETVDVLRYARALQGADAVIAAAADGDLSIESPAATESRLARATPLLRLREQGFYQVHRATPAAQEVVLAANVDPAEAGFKRLDPGRLEAQIRATAVARAPSAAADRRLQAEREQSQQLWHDILALLLLLLLIEAFAANWTAVKRASPT